MIRFDEHSLTPARLAVRARVHHDSLFLGAHSAIFDKAGGGDSSVTIARKCPCKERGDPQMSGVEGMLTMDISGNNVGGGVLPMCGTAGNDEGV